MAQSAITSFYQTRKKNRDLQPSKRRKLRHTVQEDSEVLSQEDPVLFQPDPPSAYKKSAVKNVTLSQNGNVKGRKGNQEAPLKNLSLSEIPEKTVSRTTRKTNASKANKNTKQSKTRTNKKVVEEVTADAVVEEKSKLKKESADENVAAAVDDHIVSPPCSPSKRVSSEDSQREVTRKRGRPSRQTRIDHLLKSTEAEQPKDDGYAFELFIEKPAKPARKSHSSRKKLTLVAPPSSEAQDETDGSVPLERPVPSEKDMNHSKSIMKKVLNQRESKPLEQAIEEKDDQEIDNILDTKCEDVSLLLNSEKSQEEIKKPMLQTPMMNKVLNKLQDQKMGEKSCSATEEPVKTKVKASQNAESKAKLVESKVEPKGSKAKALPSAAELKMKLAKCGKLGELQEQLAKMNKNVQKVKQARAKAEQAASKEEEASKSEEKSDSAGTETSKAPAYDRFRSLAQRVPDSLKLPYKYQVLQEMFRTMDTVVSMLHNRQEVCTFNKLRQAVQTMLNKTFETKHVGQIKTVHPSAYQYRQERNIPNIQGKSSDYQLTVQPILNPDEEKPDKIKHEQFQARHLVERKHIFHEKLIDLVKLHHKEFMSRLERPLKVPDEQLTRWHPQFPLDKVPDIEPAELPQPPTTTKVFTAKDVLAQASNQFNEKVKAALANVAETNNNKDKKGNEPVTENNNKPVNKTALKGVNQSLLDRIRAKESRNVTLAMIRSPADEKRALMLSRLPTLVRNLRTIFVTEKKPALPLDDCLKKLADSYTSTISAADMDTHLQLMMEVLPDWVSVVKTHRGRFVKLDKNRDLATLNNRVLKAIASQKT